ncbi:MAG: PQQ-binding-like beta-propeller repeat protein [Candidatus Bathyarchaeales archaeon]
MVSVFFNQTQVRVWALKTEGLTKTSASTYLLFDKTWAAPAEWLEGSNTLHYVGASDEVEGGVIAVWSKELRKHYGFSVETGDYLWETESEHFLDSYGWGNAEHTWYFAYGKLYSVGVGGIVYCYDLKTGDTLWTYTMSDEYGEPVTGNNWWGWITLISDGKVYVTTVEHSAEQPLPRGGPYICLDAETGDVVWRVNGMFRGTRWGGNSVIGDSIIATMDTYDQRIYAIGKGPTAVTVAAPDTEVELGKAVLVKGTVTDISPGTQDTAIKLRFPNGLPAVADESMSDWMLYVYKQFEKPADAKGVEVIIEVLDPNGNYYEVARTTSDANGFYSATFTPPVPGKYTVIARFAGSKAYYGSSAETALIVGEAPAATAEATPAPQAPVETYFAISTVAIIAAVILVGLLILRKR